MTLYRRDYDGKMVHFNELPEDEQVRAMNALDPNKRSYSARSCNADLAHQRQVMPRTCAVCGLGPCQRYPLKPDEAKPLRPRRTLVLSPFAGDYERNKVYAQDCMTDSLRRGEAPFLSHLLYPQVLIDGIEAEREMGLRCEHSWLEVAEQIAMYTDLGVSSGMQAAVDRWCELYREERRPGMTRRLGGPWAQS